MVNNTSAHETTTGQFVVRPSRNRVLQTLLVFPGFVVAFVSVGAAAPRAQCAFDFKSQSFVGTQLEQLKCLAPEFHGSANRRSDVAGPRKQVPDGLAKLIGQPVNIDRDRLRARLKDAHLDEAAANLDKPLTSTDAGKPALYFVLHDTSYPFQHRPIPPDDKPPMNRLGDRWDDKSWRAHAFVNRAGAAATTSDYGERLPRAATKFEKKHPELNGRFVHQELVQGRQSYGKNLKDDSVIEVPPFTDAQYATVALLYVTASEQAHAWLIPAYHIAIDLGYSQEHDDPQHFDLVAFDRKLMTLLADIGKH